MQEEERRDIKFVSTVENLGIWLGIIEVKNRKLGRKGKSIRKASCQKKMEISKLLTALL